MRILWSMTCLNTHYKLLALSAQWLQVNVWLRWYSMWLSFNKDKNTLLLFSWFFMAKHTWECVTLEGQSRGHFSSENPLCHEQKLQQHEPLRIDTTTEWPFLSHSSKTIGTVQLQVMLWQWLMYMKKDYLSLV